MHSLRGDDKRKGILFEEPGRGVVHFAFSFLTQKEYQEYFISLADGCAFDFSIEETTSRTLALRSSSHGLLDNEILNSA